MSNNNEDTTANNFKTNLVVNDTKTVVINNNNVLSTGINGASLTSGANNDIQVRSKSSSTKVRNTKQERVKYFA